MYQSCPSTCQRFTASSSSLHRSSSSSSLSSFLAKASQRSKMLLKMVSSSSAAREFPWRNQGRFSCGKSEKLSVSVSGVVFLRVFEFDVSDMWEILPNTHFLTKRYIRPIYIYIYIYIYNCKSRHMFVMKIENSLYQEKLSIWFSFKIYKNNPI